MHVITVYAPDRSKPKQERDSVLEWVDHIVGQKIMHANNFEYVIVGGDLNQELSAYKTKLSKYGITPVLDDGTTTHSKGGALDQIFTNLLVTQV